MAQNDNQIRPLVAGNWKMNGLKASLQEAYQLCAALTEPGFSAAVDVMICPPATLLALMAASTEDTPMTVGGQDCHIGVSGANTGDISAEMLADAGAGAVIVGHSERRADHGELDRTVKAKAEAAHRAGLTAIVCIGETGGERRAGLVSQVCKRQLMASLPENASAANTIIAYEPVWAIGTGMTPTANDVAEIHGFLRETLSTALGGEGGSMRLLYGGSVKPGNAKELMSIANVNGALVGGASLKAADLLGIVAAYG